MRKALFLLSYSWELRVYESKPPRAPWVEMVSRCSNIFLAVSHTIQNQAIKITSKTF
jgi:hypothetical protein